ncbi:MAG: replication initiation protein [Bacteroidaceae bacterium]|nr:replication initiation protein [Bacteroidaceae bacterium]
MESEKKPKNGKEKVKPIVVSKDSLLYQPWKLIKSGYDATAFQQDVIISVLRKLKNSLAAMRDDYYVSGARQLSLFDTKEASLFRDEDDSLTFNIHMKELGVEPQNYLRAFNAVCNIGDIDVWVPVPNPDGGEEELERAKLFSIIVKKEDVILDENNQVIGYKYEKHNPQVKLKLRRNVAETLFQGQIHTFLEQTAMNISEKFPKRLYMYFANYKNIGHLEINYWKFRQQIGFDDKEPDKIQYPKFYDFRKRVLDPSVEKLRKMADMGQAEYWFEYEPVYKGSGRAKAPDQLHFTIHLSQIGEDYEKKKGSFLERQEIEERLANVFDQTTAQIRKLVNSMKPEDYPYFKDKLTELERYFANNRGKIKDKRSYANKVLTDFLIESKENNLFREQLEGQNENSNMAGSSYPGATDGEQSMTVKESGATNRELLTIIDNSKIAFTDEEMELLDKYVGELKADSSRKIVLEAFKLAKRETEYLLYIPAMATYETFQSMFDSIANELKDRLGKDVKLRISEHA